MNIRQYAFVTAYLKHRDAVIAYKLATGSESTNLRSLQSAANRMLNKPGVREEIKSVLEATRAEVEAEIAETTRTELMTIQRKREILAMIINGQYTVMVRAKGKNCSPCTYFNSPTISQVLAGIREDNKMAGHYAVVVTRTNKKMQQIATTGVCPPLAGVSRSDGGACLSGRQGILAQDTRQTQQITTEFCPPLPAEATAKEGETQQITTTSNHESPRSTEWREAGGKVPAPNTTQRPSAAKAPAKAAKLKKLLTETTRLANAPIPATLRPFFEAFETQEPVETSQ